MKTNQQLIIALTLVAGCSSPPASKKPDPFTPPMPVSKQVGQGGQTCCLVTDASNTHVAYLLNGGAGGGDLYVAVKDGSSAKIGGGVPAGGYAFSLDGRALFFLQKSTNSFSLNWFDMTNLMSSPKLLAGDGWPASPATGLPLSFAQNVQLNGNYLLAHIRPSTLAMSFDLHVYDVHSGTDIYSRPNGSGDYSQILLPNDTLIFQDSTGGQVPTQVLYTVSFTAGGASQAQSIASRTAQFIVTADNSTLVYQLTNGELYSLALGGHAQAKQLASGVANFILGTAANGPVAWVASDFSVHVKTTDGQALLDIAASPSSKGDVLASPLLSSDGADLYYFQNVEAQENRGTLLHATVKAGATPTKIADKASLYDLRTLEGALLSVQGVDDLGGFGSAVLSARDGGNAVTMAGTVPVGGLQTSAPLMGTWFAGYLSGAKSNSGMMLVDGSPAVIGALHFLSNGASADSMLDAQVHGSAFTFADDGGALAFIAGASYNGSDNNYAGAFKLIGTKTPSMIIDGKVPNATELGPIVSRSLFINAPGASPSNGIFYVTY